MSLLMLPTEPLGRIRYIGYRDWRDSKSDVLAPENRPESGRIQYSVHDTWTSDNALSEGKGGPNISGET